MKLKQSNLTLKTAKEIALRELGTSKGLVLESSYEHAQRYAMFLGTYQVFIVNDYLNTDCIILTLENCNNNEKIAGVCSLSQRHRTHSFINVF